MPFESPSSDRDFSWEHFAYGRRVYFSWPDNEMQTLSLPPPEMQDQLCLYGYVLLDTESPDYPALRNSVIGSELVAIRACARFTWTVARPQDFVVFLGFFDPTTKTVFTFATGDDRIPHDPFLRDLEEVIKAPKAPTWLVQIVEWQWQDGPDQYRRQVLLLPFGDTILSINLSDSTFMDPASQSNFDKILSTNVDLDWTVDFAEKTVSGSATHDLTVQEDDVTEAIFDTGYLQVTAAKVDGSEAAFDLKAHHEVMGSALHVTLPKGLKKGTSVKIAIAYSTTKDCTALQWLEKEQTQGKRFPYLFSQCQPIHARALAPLQDSPSAKITYTATVRSTLPVLLSAVCISPPVSGPPHAGKEVGKDVVEYKYEQTVPIPSYLLAIASGNVVYRPFPTIKGKSWRTGIWAEPELIDAAYWEFSEDTAKFLAAEEGLVVPYKFHVYDLLVLPPAFPYGGMENACLSFLTPSLLTGDRTLVDVVVHELTHSYFGNGVTHAHAEHFWLNEGWTVYIERLMQKTLHDSEAARGFSFIIGAKGLVDDLKRYANKPEYQRLVIEYAKGEDPDDAYSQVPYEKGANLILHIERTIGGLDVFLPYVKDYVNTYIGKSITTQQWKDHLYGYYQKNSPDVVKLLDTIDWNAWFYGEGIELPVKMEYDTTLAQAAYALADRWDAARDATDLSLFKPDDLEGFNANQIIVFLERLQALPALSLTHLTTLGSVYKIDSTPNSEVRLRFYELVLSPPTSETAKRFVGDAAKWVIGDDGTGVIKGRMKFCRPVFREMVKVDRELALETWKANKTGFHPIAQRLIEKDLGLA
ncbi:Leuk-A4-hydro-C domain-containing protein [Mycena indigotica]|uniref:Leuk-A4-hydro-C domain-containing protein n=1 Tax=Mycena indigotica TaxID=2126181 RepID=A0A8H6S999_9AGAR|nr:Leuk-A4-hydro-C domain-containing protein [Mycena indigotica]KAF7295355.1 Leuk-A4-hydro-C domain-containing protein [Mycena indigotica]